MQTEGVGIDPKFSVGRLLSHIYHFKVFNFVCEEFSFPFDLKKVVFTRLEMCSLGYVISAGVGCVNHGCTLRIIILTYIGDLIKDHTYIRLIKPEKILRSTTGFIAPMFYVAHNH